LDVEMNKKTIWWRLTTVACWLMVLTLAVYAAWGEIAVHRGTTWKPLEVLLIPLSFLITLTAVQNSAHSAG